MCGPRQTTTSPCFGQLSPTLPKQNSFRPGRRSAFGRGAIVWRRRRSSQRTSHRGDSVAMVLRARLGQWKTTCNLAGQFTRTSVGFAHVPMGAIRARGVRNLFLAGRTIGADQRAYASVRVMGTAFATGFSAGISAANHHDDESTIIEKITKLGGLV